MCLHELQGDALEAAHNMQSVQAVSLFYKSGACAYCSHNTYFTPEFLVLVSLLLGCNLHKNSFLFPNVLQLWN